MAVLEELVVQLTGGNGRTSRLLIVGMLAHKLRDLARYRNTDLFPIFGKKVVLRLGSNMNARAGSRLDQWSVWSSPDLGPVAGARAKNARHLL